MIDAAACGGGASAGNGGWITPGLSGPLPAPGTMSQALRWMADSGSPLFIRPVARLSFARWSYDFWRSTTVRRYGAGMAALVALSDRTIDGFDALAARGVEFEMHADGLMFVAHSEAALDAELADLRQQAALGYRGEVHMLDREQALALEPGLAPGIAGAVFAASERHVRPESLTEGLTRHLRGNGVDIREQTTVRRLSRDGGRWLVDCAGTDPEYVDRVVVAAGVASAQLLAPLGLRLPLEGAKGYSITDETSAPVISRPVYMLESKVGASPFDGGLRLAGTLELGARDLRLNDRRLRSLEEAGGKYLRGWEPGCLRVRWAGFRPLLPDGLPVIGEVPGHDGLFVATGHGMLGVTLAPATADVLAPAVLDGRTSLELAPFSAARFDRRNGAHARSADADSKQSLLARRGR